VRWRADLGFGMRCADCATNHRACYWPLTEEFWDTRHGLSRCRACWRDRMTAQKRAQYRRDPEKFVERSRVNRASSRDVQRIKRQEEWRRIKADPVLLAQKRARARALYREKVAA
jgi:hypothetical protein